MKYPRVRLPSSSTMGHGLEYLRVQGLPTRVDLVLETTSTQFYDFSHLSLGLRLDIACLEEPMLKIGEKCSWVPALGYEPAGLSIVVGTESERVWLVIDPDNETESDVWFMNSSPRQLEACVLASSQFLLEKRSRDADLVAYNTLGTTLVEIEPSFSFLTATPIFWQNHLESVAVDLGIRFESPWTPPTR